MSARVMSRALVLVASLCVPVTAAPSPGLPGAPNPNRPAPPPPSGPGKWMPSSATFAGSPVNEALARRVAGTSSVLAWANCSVRRDGTGNLSLYGAGAAVECLWIALGDATKLASYRQFYLRPESCTNAKDATCMGGYRIATRIDSSVSAIANQMIVKSAYYEARSGTFVRTAATKLETSSLGATARSELVFLDAAGSPFRVCTTTPRGYPDCGPLLKAERSFWVSDTTVPSFSSPATCAGVVATSHLLRGFGEPARLQTLAASAGVRGIAQLFLADPVVVGAAGGGLIDGFATGPGWLDATVSNRGIFSRCSRGQAAQCLAVTVTTRSTTLWGPIDTSSYRSCDDNGTTTCVTSQRAGACSCSATRIGIAADRTCRDQRDEPFLDGPGSEASSK